MSTLTIQGHLGMTPNIIARHNIPTGNPAGGAEPTKWTPRLDYLDPWVLDIADIDPSPNYLMIMFKFWKLYSSSATLWLRNNSEVNQLNLQCEFEEIYYLGIHLNEAEGQSHQGINIAPDVTNGFDDCGTQDIHALGTLIKTWPSGLDVTTKYRLVLTPLLGSPNYANPHVVVIGSVANIGFPP